MLLLEKNLDLRDFLLSARCSDLMDSSIAEAAVRTVLRRSSGSIVSSSSSSVSGSLTIDRRRSMDVASVDGVVATGGYRKVTDVQHGVARPLEDQKCSVRSS